MNASETSFSDVVEPFVRQFGLSICFHDYSGKLENVTSFKSLFHSFATCAHVKKQCYIMCTNFDMKVTQQHLLQNSEAFFKCCHSGIIECVVPLKIFGAIVGVMFVGQFIWVSEAPISDFLLTDSSTPGDYKLPPKKFREELVPISPENLNDIKEICKTIACRLESILHQAGQISGDVDVKWRIKEFFSKNFLKAPTLNDLSKYIWLSNSRTSHILKRHFDKTFPELINCYKLDRAKNLLAYTSFSVSEIAWQSGFKDPEYLHRIFKKSEGMTPCEYRHSVELIKANPNGI